MIDTFTRSKVLQEKAHRLIPGGAHTYAKGDDQYPVLSPGFIERGEGCYVWDVDGNRYIEYGMGLRSVTLGHGYKPVVDAAYEAMLKGNNFNRPAALEVACAEAFLPLFPNAEMIKFAKNGSDVTTAAIKLARAHTGREKIAICRDQPFFSVDDWFIGTTAMNAGIPQSVQDLIMSFRYNDITSLKELFATHGDDLAGIIMEAVRTTEPDPAFLEEVQRLCRENNTVFILDEMITGFRVDLQGAQHLYNLNPDLATFGKGVANGFSVSILTGKRDIMEQGGLHHDKEKLFLLSNTHGAETCGLAAAMATLKVYQENDVVSHLYAQGAKLREGIQVLAEKHHLTGYVGTLGLDCNLVYYTRDPDGQPSQVFRTLFLQELIKRGILAPSLVVSYTHSDDVINQTLESFDGAMGVYARAFEDGVEKFLVGRPVQPVFRRFNGVV